MVAYIYSGVVTVTVLAVLLCDNIEVAIHAEPEDDDAAAATAAPEELVVIVSALLLPASAGLWLCLSATDRWNLR